MTTVRRRTTGPVEPAEEVTTGRQQDVGVRPNASIAVTAALLKYDRDTPQPFCTCGKPSEHGFGFDPQLGLYVHADPACWKPSKAMYIAGVQTRTLEGVLEPKETDDGPRQPARADRGDVHPRRARR